MRRLLALLCAGALVLGLTACGAAPVAEDDGKVHVTATLFPYYDFARSIGGDRVAVTLLLAPGRESHSYEPTPLDVIRMAQADVFLYNGGEAETWVEETMEGLDTGGQVQRRMMDYVDLLEEELAEGMEAEGGHDHDHDGDAHDGHDHDEDGHDEDDGHGVEIEYDEHIWTSPVNAMTLVTEVCEALCEADPAGADLYRANLADYLVELEDLDDQFRQVVAQGQRRLLIFGDRFPLLYFCKTYGLDYRAAFQGCSGDTEPSVQTLAYLIDKVNEEHIPVVYRLELSSGKICSVIGESTGAKTLTFHSCHNVTGEEFQNGATYLSLMAGNVEALKEGLA